LVNFGDRILFAQASLDSNHPILYFLLSLGSPGLAFFLEMGVFQTFLPDWSGTVILLISASHIPCNDRYVPLCQAIGWDGGLTSFLPVMTLNRDSRS
jgi:hypothetical protein